MIYDVKGNAVISVHNLDGNRLSSCYDVDGNKLITAEYTLVFSDEFTSEIDTSKWNFRSGYYSERYYMPEDYSNNAFIEDGCMVIRNVKDNPVPNRAWSGAFMDSLDKFNFKYGKIEARIKFPSDSSKYHATLWMMGTNSETDGWPYCGEIDIIEVDNGSPSASIHFQNANGEHDSRSVGVYPTMDVREWHTYVLEWNEDILSISVDGYEIGSISTAVADVGDYNPFRQEHYIMFNCNPYGLYDSGNPDTDTVSCYIDYIKIYEQDFTNSSDAVGD